MTHSEYFEDDKVLFAQFQLGCAAEEFLQTDLGKYLKGVAKQEIEESLLEMLKQDQPCPALHKKAQRAKDAMAWIVETIEMAKAAEYQLREKDSLEGL